MPYPTKSTPPAVFINLTIVLAILATIAFTALCLFAHRFGDDPVLLARVRWLSGTTAAVSLLVTVLAFSDAVGLRRNITLLALICAPFAAKTPLRGFASRRFIMAGFSFASRFRELVSGKRRGIGAALARGALRFAEVPYSLAVRRRNRQFDSGERPIERVDVPVISVGNITLGGTGKTPMVEWLCRLLHERGIRVAIVSRGYKARNGAANDEALELAQKLPGIPHVQGPDRVAAAQEAIAEFASQAIILDDGFQHRRIARDLDIVLVDSQEPFGFDHVFPRGTLREPLAGLARADCIVLTRADMVVPEERGRIRARALNLAPRAAWAECIHKPQALVSAGGSELPLDALRGSRVAAFCGIGNPAGFRHTLASCGYEVGLFREFTDHHAYSKADIDSLADWARQAEVAALLCTHKDLVKVGVDRLGDKPLYAQRVGLEFLTGQHELESQLIQIILAHPRGDAENPISAQR